MAAAANRSSDLIATVQHLVFDPGLYTMHTSAPKVSPTDMGVMLPCVRVESVPATRLRPGRATLVGTRESGWISPGPDPSFVLVVGGQAGAILTVYRATDGSPAPEIRFAHVYTAMGQPPANVQPQPLPVQAPPSDLSIAALAHISGVGDMSDASGNWVGRGGSNNAIEGFALTPPVDFPADGIEYQAILGNNWSTPWFTGGEFCGSRGLMLPLLGFRIQLKGVAAEEFECHYWGAFVGGKTIGPVNSGEPCAAADAPLEALRIVLTRKARDEQPAASVAPVPMVAAKPKQAAVKAKQAVVKVKQAAPPAPIMALPVRKPVPKVVPRTVAMKPRPKR